MIVEVDQKEVRSVESFYSLVHEKKRYLLRVRKYVAGMPAQDLFAVVILDLKP